MSSDQAALMQHANFIGGGWVRSSGGATYAIRNPARPTESLGEFADSTDADAVAAVDSAAAAVSEAVIARPATSSIRSASK